MSLQDIGDTSKNDLGEHLVKTISGLNGTMVEIEDTHLEKDDLFRTMESLLR